MCSRLREVAGAPRNCSRAGPSRKNCDKIVAPSAIWAAPDHYQRLLAMFRYTAGLAATTGVGVATFHFASAAADTLVQGAVLKLDESRAHFGVSHDVVSLEKSETWAASMEMDSVTTPLHGLFLNSEDTYYQSQFQQAETAPPQAKALHVFDLGYAADMQFETSAARDDSFTRDLEASVGEWQIAPSSKSGSSSSVTLRVPSESETQTPGARKHRRSNSSDSSSSATVLTERTERVHTGSKSSIVDEKGLIATVGLFLGALESFKGASSKHEQQTLYTALQDLCVPEVGFSDRSFGYSNRRSSGTGVEYILDSISITGNIPPLHCLEEVALEDGKVYVHFLRDNQPGGNGKGTEGRLLIFSLDDENRISNVMSCSA